MTIIDFDKNITANVNELLRQGIPIGQIAHVLRLHEQSLTNIELHAIAQQQAGNVTILPANRMPKIPPPNGKELS